MTTVTNPSSSNQDPEFYQTNGDWSIIWLTPCPINDEDLSLLKTLTNTILTYECSDYCVDFISDLTNYHRVIWIVSDPNGYVTIPLVHDLPQIHSIYIHSSNYELYTELAIRFLKIKAVFSELLQIAEMIEKFLIKMEKECASTSIWYDDFLNAWSSKTKRDMLDSSFMLSQILKKIILKTNFEQKDKQQLIKYLRSRYVDNAAALRVIEEFDLTYNQHSPAWWCSILN